jgi:hypothetical protein
VSQRETPPDKESAEYDPVEGVGGFWRSAFGVTNTDIAATGAKINTHVPTPDAASSTAWSNRVSPCANAMRTIGAKSWSGRYQRWNAVSRPCSSLCSGR